MTAPTGSGTLTAILAAVADPTRRTVFERLVTVGPSTATALSAELGISRQAVAKHLAQLADCRLAEPKRVGRETRYSARPHQLEPVTDWTERTTTLWHRRLNRLGEVTSGPNDDGRGQGSATGGRAP